MQTFAKLDAWEMEAIRIALRVAIEADNVPKEGGNKLLFQCEQADTAYLMRSLDRPLSNEERLAAIDAIYAATKG